MSYRSIIFLTSLIVVLAAGNFHLAQTASAAADGEQPKYALLVGITNYKSPTLNKIDGCENNVPLLAQTLIDLYGFKKQDVRTLIDGQAGKKAIVDEFRQHLIGNARKAKEQGKQAVVVYYFCGHGSQYPDQKVDADENDGLDETFVAWDSRTDSVPDILDDEIDDLKAEIRPFTHNTTLILESCHSGTGSRGDVGDNEFISEEADADNKKYPPYTRKFPPTSIADANTYVEIAASASINTAKSESREYCKCDKPYSLMTKALVEALNRATYGTTYRGLMREVSYAVSERSQQDPQVEGSVHDPLFRGAARRAKPYIDILSLLPNGQIMIRAGRIHGLKEGSQVAIYDRGSETNIGDAGWLTNGIVTEVKGLDSALVQLPTVKDNPKAAKVEIASHVVLASPVFGGGPVLLALDTAPTRDKARQSLSAELEKELKWYRLLENGMVSIVEPQSLTPASIRGARGILRLKRAKFSDAFPARIKDYARVPRPTKCTLDGDKVIPETLPAITPDTEIYYLDDGGPGGMPLFGKIFLPGSTAAADIAATVRNYALRTNLLSLSNEASTLQKGISVTPKMLPNIETIDTCEQGRIKSTAMTGQQFTDARVIKDGRIPYGAAFYIDIKNISGEIRRRRDEFASGEQLWVTCIVLRNNGDIKVAYQSGEMDPLGDGKQLSRIGGSFASKPGGPEQMIVIVSRKYVDFGFYESIGTQRISQSILEQVLKQSGIKTRDSGSVIPDEPDGWGVIRVDLNIGG